MLTVKEIGKLSRRELRERADEAFKKADEKGPGYLAEAQFYTRELEHRHDSWVSIRDLILEIVVIVLIAGELYMSYRQGIEQGKQFEKQQAILGNMEQSSGATLGALTAEQRTMEAMNLALQNQLALYYDVSINVIFDQEKKEVMFLNNGRTNVVAWGTKVGEDKPFVPGEGRVITAGAGMKVDGKEIYNLLVGRFPKPSAGSVAYELYLRNERGEDFVQRGYFALVWQGDVGIVNTQTASVMPEKWSRNIKNPLKMAPTAPPALR